VRLGALPPPPQVVRRLVWREWCSGPLERRKIEMHCEMY